MRSIILLTASRLILQIMLVVSIVMFLRGHNHPGGGFIGALIACSGVALNYLSYPTVHKKDIRRVQHLITLGLVSFLLACALPLFVNKPLFAALWREFDLLGQTFKVGTPLLFDLGVFFIILGAIAWLIKVHVGESKP